MKKPIHLYILVTLSSIASLLKIFSTFFTYFNEESFNGTTVEFIDVNFTEYLKETILLQTNAINKSFVVLYVLILLFVIVQLVRKKNESASYAYLGYLFATLLQATYTFVAMRGLVHILEDTLLHDSTRNQLVVSYSISVVLFAIYFAITAFFHLRKPKEEAPAPSTTDI